MRGAAFRGQHGERAAQTDRRVRGGERFKPDTFQADAGLVEFAAGATVAHGGAGLLPAGGPVASAREALRIDEGLGEERGVAVALMPSVRQMLDRGAEHAAGEIGLEVQQAASAGCTTSFKRSERVRGSLPIQVSRALRRLAAAHQKSTATHWPSHSAICQPRSPATCATGR